MKIKVFAIYIFLLLITLFFFACDKKVDKFANTFWGFISFEDNQVLYNEIIFFDSVYLEYTDYYRFFYPSGYTISNDSIISKDAVNYYFKFIDDSTLYLRDSKTDYLLHRISFPENCKQPINDSLYHMNYNTRKFLLFKKLEFDIEFYPPFDFLDTILIKENNKDVKEAILE